MLRSIIIGVSIKIINSVKKIYRNANKYVGNLNIMHNFADEDNDKIIYQKE